MNTLYLAAIIGAQTSGFQGPMTSQVWEMTDPIELYFFSIERLKREERWEEIVRLGEQAIAVCKQRGDLKTEFVIADQLVSTCFRLGNFQLANTYAERLVVIASMIPEPEMVIESLYKLSAVLRGVAGDETDPLIQKTLFVSARHFVTLALDLGTQHCPQNHALMAKVLFNAGASECDDPEGDCSKGIAFYYQALTLFTEEEADYRQRTWIRLGKALLLQGDLVLCRDIVEKLLQCPLEKRTFMHVLYLESQLLFRENRFADALLKAQEGRELALGLHAKADLKRFDALILLIENAF